METCGHREIEIESRRWALLGKRTKASFPPSPQLQVKGPPSTTSRNHTLCAQRAIAAMRAIHHRAPRH